MSNFNEIEHPGNIVKSDHQYHYVRILSKSACANCHSKGACSAADMEDKIVEVKRKPDESFKAGAEVNVVLKKSSGAKAVLYGYFYPFLLLLTVIITVLQITGEELIAALSGLGMLIPYYIGLYFMREKFREKFDFQIRQ